MKWFPFLLAGFFLFVPADLPAQGREEKLRQLAAEMSKGLDSRKDAESPAAIEEASRTREVLSQFREAIQTNNTVILQSSLARLPAYLDSESSRKACEDLAAEIRAETTANDQKTRREVEATIQEIPTIVRKAKAPADLDDIIARLGQYRRQRAERGSSPAQQEVTRDAESASQFVTQWQDYLSAMENSNGERVREALGGLLSREQTNFLPRSEILARLYGPTPDSEEQKKPPPSPQELDARAQGLLDQIKALDDLDPALDQFGKIAHDDTDPLRSFAATTLDTLRTISQDFATFKAGRPIDLTTNTFRVPANLNSAYLGERRFTEITEVQSRAIQQTAMRLRAILLAVSMPRYLNLPESVKLRSDDTAITFLERVGVEAVAAGDYLVAAQAADTRAFLRSGTRNGSERSQAELFIMASRQDAAHQYVLAVASYEKALAAEGNLIPAKVIGQRLDEIKVSNPQEFQQGLDMFTSPSANRSYFPYGGGMPPSGRPELPRPERPTLQIPAATPTPTFAPAK